MSKAIGSWSFSAHEYSEDDLVHIAFLMLQHALAMPELERWRLPAGMLPLITWCGDPSSDLGEPQTN